MQCQDEYYNASRSEQEHANYLATDFDTKVKYDFTKLLFLGVLPGKEAYLMEIIDEASRFQGYEKHKTIKYRSDGCERTCHLYVKYGRTHDALWARNKFREWDDLNAELVSDILKSWYTCEKLCSPYGGVTKGILDFVGRVSFNQVLDEDIVNSLLQKFGNPRINIEGGVVHVAFSSMAEGIAACIVYGKWRVKKDDMDPAFYYRVQLEGTDSFSALVQKISQSQVSETYKLEYFTHREDVPKDPPKSTFSNANSSRGRNFQRTGRQFVRSRPGYNQRPNYRQDRPKYQSSNVCLTSNHNDRFYQDETYHQQAEYSYFDQS